MKKILTIATAYSVFQRLVGAVRFRQTVVREYIKPKPGTRILDIGCGTAEIIEYMPEVEYYGFDSSEKYIATAQRHYGNLGHFECRCIATEKLAGYEDFDLVLALGILHHLNDTEADCLFRSAAAALTPNGRLITADCSYDSDQSPIARTIIAHDRGKYVRNAADYNRLAAKVFSPVNVHVRHDLLNIPYTHVIMECTKNTRDSS